LWPNTVSHIVGSVFGPIRFLLSVCRLGWFFIHIEHICSFFVAFFSATIDDRNVIFGHKLHIGTPYRGMCIKNQPSRQTESRNLMGPKTLPTIWDTDMKLVTKYQICVTNRCWEKCDEKCASMFNVTHQRKNVQFADNLEYYTCNNMSL
jgi:hypothetical protein